MDSTGTNAPGPTPTTAAGTAATTTTAARQGKATDKASRRGKTLTRHWE